jgi:hypothetical protein
LTIPTSADSFHRCLDIIDFEGRFKVAISLNMVAMNSFLERHVAVLSIIVISV